MIGVGSLPEVLLLSWRIFSLHHGGNIFEERGLAMLGKMSERAQLILAILLVVSLWLFLALFRFHGMAKRDAMCWTMLVCQLLAMYGLLYVVIPWKEVFRKKQEGAVSKNSFRSSMDVILITAHILFVVFWNICRGKGANPGEDKM